MLNLADFERELDQSAENVARELAKGRVWVRGRTGSGRHSLLDRLEGAGAIAIELPGLDDLDAALHGLVQAALRAGCLQEVLATPMSPAREHAQRVASNLAAAKKRVAILLPLSWSDSRPDREEIQSGRDRVAELLGTLAKHLDAIVVITGVGEVPPPGFENASRIELPVPRVTAREIVPGELDGAFRAAATRVADWMHRTRRVDTPLQVRLQVGLAALGAPPVDAQIEGLASRLASRLRERPQLATAVRRLLVARRPLPVAQVALVSGVETDLLPLLTSCIGHGQIEIRVAERTRQVLLSHLRDQANGAAVRERIRPLEDAHSTLADYHASADGAHDPISLTGERVIHWLEKVHHLARGGPATEDQWRRQQLVGREQYWEHAGYLSKVLRRYGDAAALYRQCIERFGEDSYSRHYHAFNVDRAHGPLSVVRTDYGRAVELDEKNPWWNARWVTFLIAHGRLDDAKAAWSRATQAIDPTGDRMGESPWLALHFHRWVCRRWLALGYVREAREVLDDIAPQWLDEEPRLGELRELIADHEEALRLGESVYPAEVPHEERWGEPRILVKRTGAGNPLVRWWPGRVLEADEDEVVVVLGDVTERLAQQVVFSADEWRTMANQPADDAAGFFELGEYEGGERVIERVPASPSYSLDKEYDYLSARTRA